ncbi:MAG: hypothetical protein KAG61_08185, partial [Bacteriovoracaceae bacterium]|nr:hypothetical protein [Bacteriovoracaceae bacterium]
MDQMVYKEKLLRWMSFSKAHKIKKSSAWPFWFEFVRMFGLDVPPLHFWAPVNIFLYFYFAALGPWIALTQYFTKDFIYSAGIINWENLGISSGICVPVALLLAWNISSKKKKLGLDSWKYF